MSRNGYRQLTTVGVQKKLLGGQPVQFKPAEEKVLIAGDALGYDEWVALRETIDRMYERIGKQEPQGAHIIPFQVSPWWLRLLGVGGTIPKSQVPKGYSK